MSIKSDLYNSFANNMSNLGNSAVNLAGTIIDYKGKEKQKAESDERLFNSNKDVLETKYRDGINGLLGTLPDSIDFDQYSSRVQDFNNNFISEARNSGSYDERTLSWLEGDFIPNQKASNEFALAGVTDYAVNAWLSNNANSKAQTIAADPTLDVENAYLVYKQYYENVGLGNIENGRNVYGYLDPEEFKEAVRGTKATQEFEKLAKDREAGYLFSSDFDISKAMTQALQTTGYAPNAVQTQKFLQDCNSVLGQIEKDVKTEVDNLYSQVEGMYNEYMLSDEAFTVGLDLSGAYEIAKTYPSAYLNKFVDLASKIEKHNADVLKRTADSYVSMGAVNDSVLAMYDSVYATTGDKSVLNAKEDAIRNHAENVARANGGNDAGAVFQYVLTGDLGITVSEDQRFGIAYDMVQSWSKAYDTLENYDDFANKLATEAKAGSPVPALLGTLYDINVTYPTDNGGENTVKATVSEAGEISVPVEADVPESTVSIVPKYDPQIQYLVNQNLFDLGNGNGAGLPKVQTTAVSSTDDPDLPTVFTSNGLSEAISTASNTDTPVNNADAQSYFEQCVKDGMPTDFLSALPEYEYMSGNLTADWLDENYRQHSWRDNSEWSAVNGYIADLMQGSNLNSYTTNQISEIQTKVKGQIIDAFRSSGLEWSEFKTRIGYLSEVFANEAVLGSEIANLGKFNKYASGAQTYAETMSANAKYGSFIGDWTSGKFDCLVDGNAVQRLLDLESTGLDEMRNNAAIGLGYTSYEGMLTADTTGIGELIVEVECGMVNIINDATEYYGKVISGLSENGIGAELLSVSLDHNYGYVFVDSNTAERGYALCVNPSSIVIGDETGLEAEWKAVPVSKDSNGKYQIDRRAIPIDIGIFAGVGNRLSTTTAEKPAEDLLSGEYAQEVEGVSRISTGGGVDFSWLTGKLAQLVQRSKTKNYTSQSEKANDTFIQAYRTAFGITER